MASLSSSEELDSLFEKAKAYLMQANKDGVSVYDQLARFMEILMDENPDDVAHDPTKFNEIFTFIQKHSFMRGESTATCNEPAPIPPQELERLGQNNTLFMRPPPEVQTTIEQPDPYTTITTTTTKPLTAPKYESVAQQNRFWSYAGYGMSEEDAFLVDRSITKLAMEKGLQDVRFVGKIFGTQSDYYIISTRRFVEEGEKIYQEVNTMPKPPRKKVEVPVQAEPGFVGVNRLSFFVTTHPAAEWVVLPDVAPDQINAARAVKRLFTGDLSADVISSPPFPWKEEVYLRAQLARITSSTYVVPQGALEEPEEEGDDEDEDEEDEEGPRRPKEAKYRPLTVVSKEFGEEELDVAQFSSLDQWVHGEAYIYKNGRQTKVPEKPEPEEEEEEEEPPQEPEEEEEEAEEVEEEEEEEKELFAPVRGDYLYSVVDIPQPPPQEDEEEEEEEEEEQPEQPEEQPPEDNTPLKPIADEEVADDDVTKMKMSAWTVRLVNNLSKTHRVVIVQSLRWPGAMGYIGENGKFWGCGYFGTGLKKTDFAFTPIPAPPILSECADITEVMDPTAATEKLVRRGEEPPEPDSEDELEEAEEDEEM